MTATDYNFRNMKDEDILNFANILKSVDYNSKQDSHSARSKYVKNNLQNRIDKYLNPVRSSSLPTKSLVTSSLPASEIEDSDDLSGSGVKKIIIPFNIIEIGTRLEVLLGLKLSGHSNTLTEASNLIDELYKKGEIQTEQQYKNAPNKFIQ